MTDMGPTDSESDFDLFCLFPILPSCHREELDKLSLPFSPVSGLPVFAFLKSLEGNEKVFHKNCPAVTAGRICLAERYPFAQIRSYKYAAQKKNSDRCGDIKKNLRRLNRFEMILCLKAGAPQPSGTRQYSRR